MSCSNIADVAESSLAASGLSSAAGVSARCRFSHPDTVHAGVQVRRARHLRTGWRRRGLQMCMRAGGAPAGWQKSMTLFAPAERAAAASMMCRRAHARDGGVCASCSALLPSWIV